MAFDLKPHLDRWARNNRVRPSKAALASAVHKLVSPGERRRVQVTSLAVKIGDLAGGKDRIWWKNNHDFRTGLCTALNLAEVDLMLDEDPPGIVRFREFPDLRPLNLHLEAPLALHDQSLFGGIQGPSMVDRWNFSDPRATWVRMPTGAGRSLLATFHEQGSLMVVVRPPAPMPTTRRPLLLLVDDPDQWTAYRDKVKERLDERLPVLVLARFGRLEQEGESPMGWSDLEWSPTESWRVDLTHWMAARLQQRGERRFPVDEFLTWLDRLDPDARIVATPSALLEFAAVVWGSAATPADALRKLSQDLAGPLLRGHLQRLGLPVNKRDFEGRREVLAGLAEARLRALDTPWTEGWTHEQWSAVRAKGRTNKRVKAEVARLINDGLLEPTSRGRHDFCGTGLRDALACDGTWLLDQAPEEWGPWAVLEDRRPVVDRALDQLHEEHLVEATTKVILKAPTQSLGTVAAGEALFAAWGRRFALRVANDGVAPAEHAGVLGRLAAFQLRTRVVHVVGGPPGAATRPGPIWALGGLEWLVSCWAWSLALARKRLPHDAAQVLGPEDGDSPGDIAWLLPGWHTPSFRDVPSWLDSVRLSCPFREDRWMARRLAALAGLVVARCGRDGPKERVPDILGPAVILADRRDWDLTHAWPLEPLSVRSLAHDIARSEPQRAQRIADRLAHCSGVDAVLMGGETPWADIRALLRRLVSPALVERWARSQAADAPDRLLQCMDRAPTRFTQILARAYLDAKPDGVTNLLSRCHRLGPGSEDLLAAWARADLHQSYMAIRALWSLSPERALKEAGEAVRANRARCHSYLFEAPTANTVALLDLLAQTPQAQANSELRRWCAMRIGWARGRKQLETAFAMLPRVSN